MSKHIFASILLCSLTLFGCATAPPVGVREPYLGTRVARVTIVDFYSTSAFGLSDDEFDSHMLVFEAATIAWLESAGVEVVPPESLRQRLEERDLAQTFNDGILLNRSLDELFEPGDDQAPLESQTVKTIAARGGFPSNALFVAEVVYQTVGVCEGDPSEFNERAVVLEPIDGATPPTPCVVSHLDAKLVDAASGATMWHNQLLIEQWYTESSDVDEIVEATIVTVVERTLDGTGGIKPLLGTTATSNQ